MKQRRYTSSDFVANESSIPDAYIDSGELNRLKQLAGIAVTEDNDQSGRMSPLGSNISITGMEKKKLEREHNIQPGTPEWFRLWFSRPYLTHEQPVKSAPKKR